MIYQSLKWLCTKIHELLACAWMRMRLSRKCPYSEECHKGEAYHDRSTLVRHIENAKDSLHGEGKTLDGWYSADFYSDPSNDPVRLART